jgi:uncharacterized membrane protein YhaH (DUF805 family)
MLNLTSRISQHRKYTHRTLNQQVETHTTTKPRPSNKNPYLIYLLIYLFITLFTNLFINLFITLFTLLLQVRRNRPDRTRSCTVCFFFWLGVFCGCLAVSVVLAGFFFLLLFCLLACLLASGTVTKPNNPATYVVDPCSICGNRLRMWREVGFMSHPRVMEAAPQTPPTVVQAVALIITPALRLRW